MYHSVAGKKLVTSLNKRDGTTLTIRDFFDTLYVPLFFGSSRMLQYINNSPFDQTFTKQKLPFSEELLRDCHSKVHQKVTDYKPDASFYLGGPAAGVLETTSGQVTSMPIPIQKEDVYASWIGAALGLTVQGGLTLLIDAEDVLLATYDSWHAYRKFLDETPKLMPLKINSWNGQWVTWRLANPSAKKFTPVLDKDQSAPATVKWISLIFALSFHYQVSDLRKLLAYVYSLGQSNTTIGFVQLDLHSVNWMAELYQKLFVVPEDAVHDRFLRLYETEESFRTACTHIEIGLRALEPKDVFNARNGIPKHPQMSETEKRIFFDLYETWIIAMLNNTEISARAENLAESLYKFSRSGTRGRSVEDQLVTGLLDKKNRKEFIDGLTVLTEHGGDYALFDQIVQDIVTMPVDNIPLFLTLVRFKYAAVKAKQKETA